MRDRAVSAHMTGDDHLALASAQALMPLQQAVEAEAVVRGLRRPDNGNSNQPAAYFDFLQQLPDLIADEQARLQEPPHTPVLSTVPPPQGAERIAGLIRDLELESAQQMGFPGGVDLMDDPIPQALVKEGDPAVEPLIKCLEEDTRLTRSLQVIRPWMRNGQEIIPVNRAAFSALAHILNTSQFGIEPYEALSTADGRKALGEKIRAYWQQNKGKSKWDITFDLLNDDHADPKQWLKAASDIVQKSNVISSPGSMFGEGSFMSRPLKPGEVAGMSGESLRGRTNPSVSDLLLKRLKAFEELTKNQDELRFRPACNLALALADWDGKAHLDDLREFSEVLKARFKPEGGGRSGEVISFHRWLPFTTSASTWAIRRPLPIMPRGS